MTDEQRGGLGKASLELTADLVDFETNVKSGERVAGDLESKLEALAAVAKIAEDALNDVKMKQSQADESKISAEGILSGVRGISDEARLAARELDRVRITETQATESDLAGDRIKTNLDGIKDDAGKAERALDRVKLRLAAARAGGGMSNRPGYGFGPFGAGYGRLGVVGTAITAGAALAPAAGPALLGLGGAGLLGGATLLGAAGTAFAALKGLGPALGGNKKAFDELNASQKEFVQTLRSLNLGLSTVASNALLPGLTKAIHAMFTPQLVASMTQAVKLFGMAMGQAGQIVGRYFGGTAFSGLLRAIAPSAAAGIKDLAKVFVSLIDALGNLAQAALPLTNWLGEATVKGARLFDTWIKGEQASGGLAHAFDAAKGSLKLVGGLLFEVVRVVIALGKALYPVSQTLLRDLVGALKALADMINRNRQNIRDFVTGALDILVGVVKVLWPIVEKLGEVLLGVVKAIGGWKTAFAFIISGFLAVKFLALSKSVFAIGTAAGEAEGAVGGLRGMLLGLGSPEVLAAIAAAAAAYIAFRALTQNYVGQPVSIGPQSINAVAARDRGRLAAITGARKALAEKVASMRAAGETDAQIKAALEKGYSGTSGRDLTVGQALVDASLLTKYAFGPQNLTLPASIQHALAAAANVTGAGAAAAQTRAYQQAVDYYNSLLKKPGETQAQKTAILTQRAEYVQAIASVGNTFGTPPPFTSGLGPKGGKPAVIPAGASHDLALASANASRARVLGNTGKAADKFLNLELGDLQAAAKLIQAKYATSTGKARTQLFSALVSVQNKIRTVREELGKAIGGNRAAELQFAVDQAKEAVAAAAVGSAAYDKAIAAEEKALRKQIAYLATVAKNSKLSLAARTKALRAETADENTLKSLLKKTAAQTGSNEAQFLSSFAQILTSFAPNAFPTVEKSGKTDTHLFDIKNVLKSHTPHIKKAAEKNDFPATSYALAGAGALVG